ncbi:hypothetical protein JCM1841_001099 [Sporobolomyces salmonicolor]
MSAHSSSSSSAASEEETWDDWTEESQQAHSLFDDLDFPNAQLALQHDKDTHGVDLALLASTLDFFERIRLINWIRATKPDPASLKRLDRNATFLEDDQFLKPVLEDDPLLQLDFDSLSLSSGPSQPAGSSSTVAATPASPPVSSADPTAHDLVEALRAQLADSNAANEQLRRIVRERCGSSMGLEEIKAAQKDEEGVKVVVDKGKGKEGEPRKEGEAAHQDDDHYFESYQYNDIHEIMLKDAVRTNAYRDFITHPANAPVFKDKIVLDVGCGTGILSMFAAKAGAKKVYAVDASNVAFKAMRNIKANGLNEVITVIKGKVEEINLPEKVDVIISEWMGYCLLYECMLDSVLLARDKYLAPGGLMVPSQTSILLSLFAGKPYMKDRVTFWDQVYGFDMKAMKEGIEEEAIIDVVDNAEVVSGEVAITDILTGQTTISALSFATPFSLSVTRAPSSTPSASSFKLHAFLAHFDTYFTASGHLANSSLRKESVKDAEGEVFFTTGAWDTATHWKQTMFLLKEPIEVQLGSIVEGTIKVSKNPDNSRELLVEMIWTVQQPGAERKSETKAQVWKVR